MFIVDTELGAADEDLELELPTDSCQILDPEDETESITEILAQISNKDQRLGVARRYIEDRHMENQYDF